ncbi:hypothetical protein DFJ58DRAFT_730159 [Suillus subalutaceus]|uniref:uncharacterized protein n=1 Tax=Suillus subalutaceus TaxID=48586 RepID=UPI001B8768ED|nr:uncharacterized protein DFJ58DRAFT_730159 [Suillus subalutaceus]KAG1847551.1 hypothetical protein DFJ58DRAFT_730159 [Suillus subalutaceus]
MGSSSGLDLNTSSLSHTLSPPTPPTQTSTPDTSQMLIPPASDPILRFLPSSLLNHGSVQGQSVSLPVPSFIFMLLLARCCCLSAMLSSPLPPLSMRVFILYWPSAKKEWEDVEERLARETIAIVNGDSKTITDKELAHKQAMVNKGNALKRSPVWFLMRFFANLDALGKIVELFTHLLMNGSSMLS